MSYLSFNAFPYVFWASLFFVDALLLPLFLFIDISCLISSQFEFNVYSLGCCYGLDLCFMVLGMMLLMFFLRLIMRVVAGASHLASDHYSLSNFIML